MPVFPELIVVRARVLPCKRFTETGSKHISKLTTGNEKRQDNITQAGFLSFFLPSQKKARSLLAHLSFVSKAVGAFERDKNKSVFLSMEPPGKATLRQ